ncbi:hypothetical protein [Geothrix sp. PMB-07]|uniref:hypothetical protein n=1 Tax=Geothrix sp. PMB-07 TaxID=3068640 RepID=UPI0027415058|nr:hypothetical protein [Geothrix sp. PMB-07]WLT33353.1 hypothetical protein Q9293_08440 [Geothrix sp. PMB-07]
MSEKKPRMDVRAFAKKGASHRSEEHMGRQPGFQEPEAIAPSGPKSQVDSATVRRGGRKRAFEETVKVSLFLPPDVAGDLKALAAQRRLTPSQLVAEWTQKNK